MSSNPQASVSVATEYQGLKRFMYQPQSEHTDEIFMDINSIFFRRDTDKKVSRQVLEDSTEHCCDLRVAEWLAKGGWFGLFNNAQSARTAEWQLRM